MTRAELLERIKNIVWSVTSQEKDHGDPVGYRMQLINELLDEYEQPTHKKIDGVDGYLGPDIPADPLAQSNE